MIIPVKCFTCGNVLADKYLFYIKEVRKIKISKDMDTDEVLYLDNTNVIKYMIYLYNTISNTEGHSNSILSFYHFHV